MARARPSRIVQEVFNLDRFGNPLEVAIRLAEQVSADNRKQPTLLVVSANGRNTGDLQLATEQRIIQDEMDASPNAEVVSVRLRPAAIYEDLSSYLLVDTPCILHLAGHGTSAGITLQGERGLPVVMTSQQLARLLSPRPISASLRLVVLNACWSDAQAQAIVPHVDAVIGMESAVADDVALEFARGLYRGLAYGLSVEDAMSMARGQIAPSIGESGGIGVSVNARTTAADVIPMPVPPA